MGWLVIRHPKHNIFHIGIKKVETLRRSVSTFIVTNWDATFIYVEQTVPPSTMAAIGVAAVWIDAGLSLD